MKKMLRMTGVVVSLVAMILPLTAYQSSQAELARRKSAVDRYRAAGVFSEKVYQAVMSTPREYFMPDGQNHMTYEEVPVAIGWGQTITNQWFVAYMTHLLDVQASDKVLEIGSGSGYQASILWQITKKVYTIEIVSQLAAIAKQRWQNLGYSSIVGKAADGYYGWAEYGPFDKIVVTCAADHVPVYLMQQLKPGGVMVIPVGNPFDRQTLLKITKNMDGTVRTERLQSVKFVPFTGKMLEKYGK